MRAALLCLAACSSGTTTAKPVAPPTTNPPAARPTEDPLCSALDVALAAAPGKFDSIKVPDPDNSEEGYAEWESKVQIDDTFKVQIKREGDDLEWIAEYKIPESETAKAAYQRLLPRVGACPALQGRTMTEELHEATDGIRWTDATWAGPHPVSFGGGYGHAMVIVRY